MNVNFIIAQIITTISAFIAIVKLDILPKINKVES